MRTSILARSAIAVATLAVTAGTLAATPATAATSTGVTRDMVLTAANGVRTAAGTDSGWSNGTDRALLRLITRTCNFEYDYENHLHRLSVGTPTPGSADGVIVVAELHEFTDDDSDDGTFRLCTFAAVASTDVSRSLTGKVKLDVTPTPYSDGPTIQAVKSSTSALSGDVFVTKPVITSDDFFVSAASFSATGAATKTVTTKVSTPKTTKQKKAAKKAYAKKLKAAKKSYKKAIDKAGDSKSKKSKAKKTYAKKKKSAKATYKKKIATSKIVKKTDGKPFSLSATAPDESPLEM